MNKIFDLYQQTRKLIMAIVAGLAPIGVQLDLIFADEMLTADDMKYVVAIVSIIGGWAGVYWSRNKVGSLGQ